MRTCDFDGCERRHDARGYCRGHYQQFKSGRELKPLGRCSIGFEERFWQKVQKGSECWEWTGSTNNNGYGTVRQDGKSKTAHRVAYELAVGPIPAGNVVDHVCFNKSCVNPAHLNPCTQKQNLENRPSAYSNSKTGVRGVYPSPHRSDKWVGQVKHAGKIHYLGTFDTIAEAEAVVIAKRNELFTNNLLDRKAA